MIVLQRQDRVASARRSWQVQSGDRSVEPRAETAGAEIAVICCTFNWAGFRRPVYNLRRFLRQMDLQGIPVFGVEAFRPGTEPIMSENPRWQSIAVSDRGILWQKEALLNQAAKLVPANIRKIAVIDPDVAFDNRDWAEKACRELDRTPAIQPFERAVWTDQDGAPSLVRQSAAKGWAVQSHKGHPGFGWAFRRSFFSKVGFYPFALTGTGDTVLATGILNLDIQDFPTPRDAVGEPNFDIYHEWRGRCRKFMAGCEAGFVDGDVWHEWHGSLGNRRYHQRHEMMAEIDVLRDIEIQPAGWLQWSKTADRTKVMETARYFYQRLEDGDA